MANTSSATLSIRLKPEVKKRLAKLAKVSGRSSNFLISEAVESYVADQERMLGEIRQADRQVKSGHYVRHEDMKAWLLSWCTDRELPPPKCVCGKVHADESPRPRSLASDRTCQKSMAPCRSSGSTWLCFSLHLHSPAF